MVNSKQVLNPPLLIRQSSFLLGHPGSRYANRSTVVAPIDHAVGFYQRYDYIPNERQEPTACRK